MHDISSYFPTHPYLRPYFEYHSEWLEFIVENRQKMGDIVLNVGLDNNPAGPSWPWVDWLVDQMGFKQVWVLEIYPPNFEFHRDYFMDRENVHVVLGDVRNIDTILSPKSIDTILWNHGPEHIPLGDLGSCMERLETVTRNCLLLCCPWGSAYALDDYRFPEDKHWYFPENEHFEQLGFTVINTGYHDSSVGQINAYKFLEK